MNEPNAPDGGPGDPVASYHGPGGHYAVWPRGDGTVFVTGHDPDTGDALGHFSDDRLHEGFYFRDADMARFVARRLATRDPGGRPVRLARASRPRLGGWVTADGEWHPLKPDQYHDDGARALGFRGSFHARESGLMHVSVSPATPTTLEGHRDSGDYTPEQLTTLKRVAEANGFTGVSYGVKRSDGTWRDVAVRLARLVPNDKDAEALVRSYAQLKPGKSRGMGGLHRLADLLHEKFPDHPAAKWLPHIMTHPELKVYHFHTGQRRKLRLDHTIDNYVRYGVGGQRNELAHNLVLSFGGHRWTFKTPVQSVQETREFVADNGWGDGWIDEARRQGLPEEPPTKLARPAEVAAAYTPTLDPKPSTLVPEPSRSRAAAEAYAALKHDPTHPDVAAAYAALKREVKAQYDHMTRHVAVTYGPEPYPSSDAMRADVAEGRLRVNPTGPEMDPSHPLAEVDPDTGRMYNDLFRAVHDYFGHAVHPHHFGPKGEIRAWEEHAKMFSPEARRALTTETHGQNSWVNFGPHSHLPVTERPFAEQKAALLPEEHWPKKLARAQAPSGGAIVNNQYQAGGRFMAHPLQRIRTIAPLLKRLRVKGGNV